jgi:hypothetical protein
MRFVPIKTEDQQSRLLVHRARQGFVQARTATPPTSGGVGARGTEYGSACR